MSSTPDSPAKMPDDRTTQGGNYWTLFIPGIWKLLHAVLQMQTLAQLLGLPEGSIADDIISAVRAMTTTKMAVDPSKYLAIELFQEAVRIANTANAGITRQSAEIAVAQAQQDRKLLPFMREWAISLCMANKPAFGAFLMTTGPALNHFLNDLAAPAMAPLSGGWGGQAPGQDGLSQPADAVLTKLGLTADDVKRYGAPRA